MGPSDPEGSDADAAVESHIASRPRVLLVYGYQPSGHSAAAFALEAAGRAAGLDMRRVEVAGEHHPGAGTAVARGYHGLLRASPAAWDALYKGAWVRSVLRAVRGAYLAFGGGARLRRGVERRGADLVVCPQAAVAAVFAEARVRGHLEVPVVSVLTDYAVHPFWASPPSDLTFAPDDAAAAELERLGVPSAALRVAGIPIHPAFARLPRRAEARALLGLPSSAPVVLLSGGAKGLGGLGAQAEALLARAPGAMVLALCGVNERLRRALGGRVRAFGPQPPAFVAALMAAADLHLCKPGGLSVAESLAAGLPLVLCPALGGQESENARRLERRGAAVPGGGAAAAALLADRARLGLLRARAAAAGRPRAAATIVAELARLGRKTLLAC